MTSTTQTSDDALPRAASTMWCLVLAHHHDLPMLGRRICLVTPSTTVLGRDAELLGHGVFASKAISHRHARLDVDEAGRLSIEDLGSKNGTLVNGLRIARAELRPNDVVGVGGCLLVVGRTLEGEPAIGDRDGLDGVSTSISAVCARARDFATSTAPVIVLGEAGSGKERVARLVHTLSGRRALAVVRPGTFVDDEAPALLFGAPASQDETRRRGLLEGVEGGTLVIDDLELAGPNLQAALLRAIGGDEPSQAGERAVARTDVRVIVMTSTRLDALARDGVLLPALVGRLGKLVLEVPPLRDRCEDVPVLFRALLGWEGMPTSTSIDEHLVLALLRHRWPGNVRELEAFAHFVARTSSDATSLTVTPERLAALTTEPDVFSAVFATEPDVLFVARDGTWFSSAEGRVDLVRRPNLARIVGALARHHDSGSTGGLSVDALFEAGWPDERVAPAAANARVYVAVSTLRKLGLRTYLERKERGYELDAARAIRVIGPP